MRGCFLSGTDTGAGKSVLCACLAAALAGRGVRVGAHKPVLTGTDEPPGRWPSDDRLLALASGQQPEDVAPLRFGPAVSPHLAAELAGAQIGLDDLLRRARRAARGQEVLLVEGVGGLLVPLNAERTVRDLAVALGLPLLIAARPGLGTINHTLLTLEAARTAELEVRAVVLTPWPARPGRLELSNRDTIERLGELPVHTLATLRSPSEAQLAAAGETLPVADWLGPFSDRPAL